MALGCLLIGGFIFTNTRSALDSVSESSGMLLRITISYELLSQNVIERMSKA